MLMAAGAKNNVVEPVGIDFDGTNDYLSRSTDLVGNVDSKTFTFSAWLWPIAVVSAPNYFSVNTNKFLLYVSSANVLRFLAKNEAGTGIIDLSINGFSNNKNWNHVLIACDLTDVNKRHVYINGQLYANVSWATYTNDAIDFTGDYGVGASSTGSNKSKSRLSNFYLDHTYRDLSIEANRRLFITEDGKPAKGQASLNPIIYLPLDDFEAPGVNLGTGGDFTLNGVVAQSGRGPNQWNCVASEFDGSADYLSSTGIGAGSSNTVTFSFQVTPDLSSAGDVFGAYDGGSTIGMQLRLVQDGTVSISAQNTSGSYLLGSSNTGSFRFTSGKSHSVQFSVDLSDSTKTVLIVNGSAIPISFFQFLDDVFDLNDSFYVASAGLTSNRLNAALGELYFDTTYIDLAADNPFWDDDTQKPKPVLQVLEETGATPLIAMPIRADDAGRNYGTGGDFTVDSGPFVGARGASEFWARSADFGTVGGNNNLQKASITTQPDTLTYTCIFSLNLNDNFGSSYPLAIFLDNTIGMAYLVIDFSSNSINFRGTNASGTIILNKTSTFSNEITFGKWYTFYVCVDMADAAKTFAGRIGSTSSTNIGTFTQGQSLEGDFQALVGAGKAGSGSTPISGSYSTVGGVYFTTDYIDFSQESERLKFVDAFGYPVDIRPAIENGDIPEPLIYMPFDDPNDLGKNLGTGGDFTVNGTVTPGADVDPN